MRFCDGVGSIEQLKFAHYRMLSAPIFINISTMQTETDQLVQVTSTSKITIKPKN